MRIVLLTKMDRFSREAQAYARKLWPNVEVVEGSVRDPRPKQLALKGDILISFLSPWIITLDELARFPIAINFHPAPVEYPGTGCYNFALYDEAPEYGATCHHMLPKVDTGKVVLERRFAVLSDHTVETLKLATMETMLGMFRDVVELIARGEALPQAPTHWTRRPYLHREMEALKRITDDMSKREQDRRIRATVYPGYSGPVIHRRDGSTVPVPVPSRQALA